MAAKTPEGGPRPKSDSRGRGENRGEPAGAGVGQRGKEGAKRKTRERVVPIISASALERIDRLNSYQAADRARP